jgi:hypothetical protein
MTREIGPELIARLRHVADSLEAIVRGEVDSPQPFAAAYAVYLNGEYDSSYGPDAIDEALEIAADCNGEVIPLYRTTQTHATPSECSVHGESSTPQSHEKNDEKRMNTNTNRDATRSEGSVQSDGMVGVADIAYETAKNLQGVCKTFDQWSRETACVMHRLARHIELLESRVPSAAEREAIAFFAELRGGDFDSCLPRAATLRELLERLK